MASGINNRSSHQTTYPQCCTSKWFAIALIVSSLVIFGSAAIFGGLGLFLDPCQMPAWMLQGVNVVGFGCLLLLLGGSYLALLGASIGIALLVKKSLQRT